MRRRAGGASPSRSVNRSLREKNARSPGCFSSSSSPSLARSTRARNRRSCNKRGEGSGPPTIPRNIVPDNGRCAVRPNGGIPPWRRISKPPPRAIAATPPRPPPPNSSARWAVSMAFARERWAIAPAASAVAVAPAALIPNPCPTGSWCVRRINSSPSRSGRSRRATSSDIGSGIPRSLKIRVRRLPLGRNSATACTPSSRTIPAPVDPRARGSRSERSGAKNPVTWAGAKAAARTSPDSLTNNLRDVPLERLLISGARSVNLR